jgi:vitamin B12 transporter
VDALYFDNHIRDLIAYQFPLMMNINEAQITGQELSYAGDWGNKHLKASVTLQNPRDTGTGQQLLRRAKQFAHIGASHEFADWSFGAEVRYSGSRPDVNSNTFPATSVILPGYSLFNLTSRYSIDMNLNVTARVDNLFNRKYSDAYGYNPLKRTLFVGINYQQ